MYRIFWDWRSHYELHRMASFHGIWKEVGDFLSTTIHPSFMTLYFDYFVKLWSHFEQ